MARASSTLSPNATGESSAAPREVETGDRARGGGTVEVEEDELKAESQGEEKKSQ